ncbi:MAG: lipid A biosynthesis lauroyl acyltransferase [Alphaproteobacteria bacterium]|nr:lipid A biosynthesis lauroyl acyltransferase [Alphaproteobacteria bacterium]MBU0795885.1 lipid A biosynthesis lauroyl acyltransferase [Alphaproteobacteria bacterium]MBU0888579.1 lipid A biosynthesis lauroyl acyltransferase [Alphaproteobacteria bacterium]MBU1813687.1 lipid A biosynthesis lauroyl acyltransferase [Alphaproteobacteria bacterium]MBU2090090.1 lipid A biosynthesis lauroyl acyltransferase [Alphaproteobacteria bacterium]
MTPRPWTKRWIVHPLEAAAIAPLYLLMAVLPIDTASALGGWLGRNIGTRVGISRRARRNLERAFPEKSAAEIDTLLTGMWDNLGRLIGEYPHLPNLAIYDGKRVELQGIEHVDAAREDGKPALFFSGHIGNWELISLAATQRGLPLTRIYRAANNPLIEKLILWGRRGIEGNLVPKGREGATAILETLRAQGHVGLLIDQKMNEGIPVDFFGRPAMTGTALAAFALRYRCPVIPARVERLEGCHFRITVEPPLVLPDSGDRKADIEALTITCTQIIERWVRDQPAQWLWLHRRWRD